MVGNIVTFLVGDDLPGVPFCMLFFRVAEDVDPYNDKI